MSTAIPTALDLEPQPRRFTRTELQQMTDWGWFNGHAADLRDGEVWESTAEGGDTRRRWSLAEYYQMSDAGWFDDQRVMLLDGEVLVMAIPKSTHVGAVRRAELALAKAFGPAFWARTQTPLEADPFTDAEPDVAVVPGSFEDYEDHHPTTALLVVEVSDATLSIDRNRKARLYARAGIQDYWIVNLVDRQVEVHRQPVEDDTQVYRHRYAQKIIARPGETVSPLAAPDAQIAVADLLPKLKTT
jgi:Uma2 family endonuclease